MIQEMNQSHPNPPPAIQIPAIGALACDGSHASLVSTDGEIHYLPHDQVRMMIHKQPVLCCHAPYVRQKIGKNCDFFAFDVLELFAFVHPGLFCVPTIYGLCDCLNLPKPNDLEESASQLYEIARTLLEHLRVDPLESKAPAATLARLMGMNGKGWPWAPYICAALGEPLDDTPAPVDIKPLFEILKTLPEWEEEQRSPPHSHFGVEPIEATRRLDDLLHNISGQGHETREAQKAYTRAVCQSFAPPAMDGSAHITLAEAGTGTGKTLGYLAPASLWAEKNEAAVWISTYTKNLQRQIEGELRRLYPQQADMDRYVAVRKGRENYLCLLNLHENIAALPTAYNPQSAAAAGIMVRWIASGCDGDLSGAAFPGWLSSLLGFAGTLGLADRRGECIYSACDYYRQCYSEHSIRHAKQARLVIANHALVMIQAAMAGSMDQLPDRYIFDEGHHLFDAADSAFCSHLSAQEARDLRRWLLGPEGGRRAGRARGIKRRIEDLCEGDETLEKALQDLLNAAHQLPGEGWTRRLKNTAPAGMFEEFFYACMSQVYARAPGQDTPYSLETPLHPAADELIQAAEPLIRALRDLLKPSQILVQGFVERLNNDGLDGDDMMNSDTRRRLESVIRTLEHRGIVTLQSWVAMLDALKQGDQNSGAEFIDWMEITRSDGQAVDVGLFRHWIDPMKPFSTSISKQLHGAVMTSATLRDQAIESSHEQQQGWDNAMRLSGAPHFNAQPSLFSTASPFNYAQQSRVFIIDDVNKNNSKQLASAFYALCEASGGGALGLFTAIHRLRQVHEKIVGPMEQAGYPLYAQHVDAIDIGTLIDMFRFDPHACMLGTDATRDGVDVPGHSLRLLAFDRVPWPRPNILHKARRQAFGGRAYDEGITRLKLKQAFGRLIRRADDKGVFVMMDSGFPSRLHDAFPPDVEIVKCGLKEACDAIKVFLLETP